MMLSKKFRQIKLLIPILALLLLTTAYQLYASVPAAFAHVTLEVNPALVMTIDSENKIIAVEFKDDAAKELFSGVVFNGMDLNQALEAIAGQLKEAGFLSDEEKVLLTVHPAEGVVINNLTVISEQLHEAFDSYLEQLQVKTPVETVVLDHAVYNAARKAGLWPSDYIVLVANVAPGVTIAELEKIMESAGLASEDIRGHHHKVFEAYMDMREAGLTEAEALEIISKTSGLTSNSTQVYKIASGFADMQEAGISFADALKIFEFSQTVDHKNFTKIITNLISDMIDLHEAGLTVEAVLAELNTIAASDRSIKEVRTILNNLEDPDDLLEPSNCSCDCDYDDKPCSDKTKNCSCDCDYDDDKLNRQGNRRNKVDRDRDDNKYDNDDRDDDSDDEQDDEQDSDDKQEI